MRPRPPVDSGLWQAVGRHNISNIAIKIDGQWLFSKRRIYNENRDEWAFKSSNNPAW